MEFSRVGQHTIKCVISEEEIMELGFSMDEIMGHGERTQAFMNQIFDMAEKEFETKFDMGIKTVRADFLPDHTLSLTFSEHPGAGGMVEHLKDIVNGLLNSIPSEKWEEIKAAKESLQEKQKKADEADENRDVIAVLEFMDMETVIRFSKMVVLHIIPLIRLFKYDGRFYLLLDLMDTSEENMQRLSVLTDEYANDIWEGRERLAFLEEHAEIIMKEEAIEHLRML